MSHRKPGSDTALREPLDTDIVPTPEPTADFLLMPKDPRSLSYTQQFQEISNIL